MEFVVREERRKTLAPHCLLLSIFVFRLHKHNSNSGIAAESRNISTIHISLMCHLRASSVYYVHVAHNKLWSTLHSVELYRE